MNDIEVMPWGTLPTTDDEAKLSLRRTQSGLRGESMVGIFDCRRMLGDDLMTAYEKALRANLGLDK